MSDAPTNRERRKIVLLGIGHTNAHVVKEWTNNPISDCDLICISNFATTTYSGMLPGTLGKQFDDNEMRINLRSLTDKAGATLVIASVTGLNLRSGEVLFSDRDPIRFDALSIGVGSMPAGWDRYVNAPSVVPIKPMQTFLQRLDTCLHSRDTPRDRTLRVAIAGGGLAAIEIALCLLH